MRCLQQSGWRVSWLLCMDAQIHGDLVCEGYLHSCRGLSCRAYQCYAEEDFLGLVKPIAVRAILSTPKRFEETMINRYMIRRAIA